MRFTQRQRIKYHLIKFKNAMTTKKQFIYNLFMAALAMISIIFITLDYAHQININSIPFLAIDNLIFVIFTIDYLVRLVRAENKKAFFKSNIFDLLSIIPVTQVSAIFRITRIGRLLRLLRILRIARLVGLAGRLESFLKMNGLLYYLYTSLAVVLITAALYSVSEKVSFSTAIWWSIVTSTTVGYGDISPTTLLGRIAAVIDMLVGIGLIGMLTSSITEYFAKPTDNELSELKAQNERLAKKLTEIEALLREKNND